MPVKQPANNPVHIGCDFGVGDSFSVVIRYQRNRIKSIHHPVEARGLRANEIWINGEPSNAIESEILDVINLYYSWLPKEMIHLTTGMPATSLVKS